ncbi:MAG: dTMP kinase [Candidatus Acidifodinimicrobium sp.]
MIGKLIDIEGIDKSGKTTQIKLILEKMKRSKHRIKVLRYPDRSSVYGKILDNFLKGRIILGRYEQVLLFLLDMLKDQEYIKGEIEKGNDILLDRYFISTIAYQTKNKKDYDNIKKIIESINLIKPDLIIYLDIKPETSLKRLKKEALKAEIFENKLRTLKSVRDTYLKMRKEGFPTRNWEVINASKDMMEINSEITTILEKTKKNG